MVVSRLLVVGCAAWLIHAGAPGGWTAEPARPLDFNRDVRPILSNACFACHGPDPGRRQGGLRLDTRAGAFADVGGGPVIVAGKPEESELLARVESTDEDERMPPPGSGKALTPAQVATLRRWVAEGAVWTEHWAYRPPRAVPAPDISSTLPGFARNAVDRFVLAGLARQGLTPSAEADRTTLIRRLTFDLTGLPPTPTEVDAFLADDRPDAYERLVDRLLGSPRHGERLAAWWLDLVRYADTTGYHGDNHRDVALYRDWVIAAFNANVPFDRFTVEQLAGDLLPGAGDAHRIASGYNKLLMTTREGGAQPREYTARYAADRVRNASTVWLASTLGCAECHDHKYDPFTARDFYRFAAFFADITETAVGSPEPTKFPTPDQAAALRAIDAEQARLQAVLDTPTAALATAQKAWEAVARKGPAEWHVLPPTSAVSDGGATLALRDDGSIAVSGKAPERDVYRITVAAPKTRLTGLKLDLLADGTLPGLGPGRAVDGNFVLNEIELSAEAREPGPGAPAQPRRIAWSRATATHAQDGFPVAWAIDGDPKTGWAIGDAFGRPNHAVFEVRDDHAPERSDAPPATLTLTLRFDHGARHTLGRFRLSATGAERPLQAGSVPSRIQDLLERNEAQRSEAEHAALAAYYRSIAPLLQPTRDALAETRRHHAAIEAAMPSTLITRAGAPRVVRLLPRGNWLDESGPVVLPALPASLAGDPARSDAPDGDDPTDGPRRTRLDLARWIVAPENPLTARVLANRLWGLFLGQGLVATPDDFGAQGAPPTHPELLDRLALELTEHGWNVRRLIRLIVTSGTYRQTSHASDLLRQRDPYNQWLARQGRFRLDAEAVRDTALAVSGLLVEQVGGPSARPYQPAGYWSHLNFPRREYQADHGPGLHRRGLYTYWCRTFLHPSLLAFDAPTREECTVQRARSNTPLQALVLLNDPTYVEAARSLAERTLREGGSDTPSRLAFLYRSTLSRRPRAEESAVLTRLLRKHHDEYAADPNAARQLVATGERPVAPGLDPVELAAWTSLARAVLNLHETITRF